MNQSEIETQPPPEWLVKLEERREKKLKSKLGHESGAGAPCNECGNKCPGLDLHFWRKVCRNCKCRKDQHMCPDDDVTGWAQFEILGQIRSKPAFIKIKALADQPVKLDWVPPNSDPEIVSDYMNKLGSNKIPISGSDAAAKRKQQLQFQVPAHDMDAALCDNLTESEAAQLEQYVKKIRENCVGQGNVVRIGDIKHAQINHLKNYGIKNQQKTMEIIKKVNEVPKEIVKDKIAVNLLNSEKLTNALLLSEPLPIRTHLIAHSEIMKPSMFASHIGSRIQTSTKEKLKDIPINIQVAESVITNGPFYDKMLTLLERNNFDISKDPILQPIKDFRFAYLSCPTFKSDIDNVIRAEKQYSTPIKQNFNNKYNSDSFNSPIPVRSGIQPKMGSIMNQETPMRKVKFGGVDIYYDLGLPTDAKIEKDKILWNIVNSEQLANKLKSPYSVNDCKPLVTELKSSSPDFLHSDLELLSPQTRNKLKELSLNKDHLLSGYINGDYYDKIFDNLEEKLGNDYSNWGILYPLKLYRKELLTNQPFANDIARLIKNIPNSQKIAISTSVEDFNPKGTLTGSRSTDSGFESKPSTPSSNSYYQEAFSPYADASLGKFASIPGIEDLNMYPTIQPSHKNYYGIEDADRSFADLNISDQGIEETLPVPVSKCKDCENYIMSGEVAVKAERAGKDIVWHPECFKCHTCNELLADLVYFFHMGNVYCGRDLAILLKIPRCNACDELIFTKEYTAAENSTFHIKHFCCYQCDIPLAGQQYIPDEKTNMPLCLTCYDQFYAERCKRCEQQIGPTEQGVKWGDIHWHGTCFICAGINCGKSLIGGRFCVKQEMPFCSPTCVRSVIN